jgi:hypothetical protein
MCNPTSILDTEVLPVTPLLFCGVGVELSKSLNGLQGKIEGAVMLHPSILPGLDDFAESRHEIALYHPCFSVRITPELDGTNFTFSRLNSISSPIRRSAIDSRRLACYTRENKSKLQK